MSDYGGDILSWSEHQARLLRQLAAGERVNDQIDWPNVAEEIESLGQAERRALATHIRTIIEHLAKLQISSAVDPRAGWADTIDRTRVAVEALLEDSPSLRPHLDEMVSREHPRTLRLAVKSLERFNEMPGALVDRVPYTPEQVLGDWFPTP